MESQLISSDIYIVKVYHHLSSYLQTCPAFDDSYASMVAAICSWNAWHLYMVIGVIALYHRSMFHVMLELTLGLTAWVVWLAPALLPETFAQAGLARCSPYSTSVIAMESAIVGCVTAFMVVWNVWYERASVRNLTVVLVALVGFVIASLGSLLYLELYRVDELYLGWIVGTLAGGAAAMVCGDVIAPHWGDAWMQGLQILLGTNRKYFQ